MPKTKRASPRQIVVLTKGDWLDVMDQDGVWNVARVLSVPSSEEVEVMYDGWPDEYDEVVRVDSDRVAPYHTFTWAVKCWVKYLNWPLWPSVITIRTPGTLDGIKNLSLENRLYVDFLEDPTFANRDRCWQKKRQVKLFDSNFDKNRKQTNGAQFELAFGCALQSDATTKMPTFVRGTLPLQYENSTTESVDKMRKNMGTRLWYRNFANNKERHMMTHKYVTIGDEDDESSSDEAVPAPKLKVQRPKTSSAPEEQDPSPQKKKKRSIVAKTQPIVVKIEQEPLAQVGLEDMDSSDDQESEGERNAARTKKRGLRSKGRSGVSPMARKEMTSKKKNRSSSPEDINAASSMPRHVTVLMDEIIVDDEDSGVDEDRRKMPKKTGRSPSKPATVNTSTRVKEESDSTDDLALEATDTNESSRKRRLKAKTTSPHQQRIQQGKTKKSITHRKTRNSVFSEPAEPARNRKGSFLSLSGEDSDDDMYSDGFDPGITSEDKAASPIGSQFNSQDSVTASLLNTKSKTAERSKMHAITPHSTKTKSKGQSKMAARRSVPPLQEDLSLIASPKSRSSIRSPRSLSDEDDWEEEEKGFFGDVAKEVERHDKPPKNSVTRSPPQHSEDSKQDVHSGLVATPKIPAENKPPKRVKAPLPLIDQRIAFAKEVLRDLDEEKKEASKAAEEKERQRRSSSSSSSVSRDESQAVVSRAKNPRSYQPKSLDFSFLQVDDKENGSSINASEPQGKLTETPLDLDFSSNQLGHSFLSVVQEADSSDQEVKGMPTQFDEDMALDFQSDPKEAASVTKAEAKSLPAMEIVASANQRDEDKPKDDDDGEERAQDVSRRFHMMQAGVEGTLDGDDEENAEPRNTKKTVISVPRKFDGVTKEAAHTSLSPLPTPLAVFSSSKGFSMENWFKRTLTVDDRSSKT